MQTLVFQMPLQVTALVKKYIMNLIKKSNFIFSPILQTISYYLLFAGSNGITLPLIIWMLAGFINPFSIYTLYSSVGLFSPILLFSTKKYIEIFPNLLRTLGTIFMISIVGISLFKNYKINDASYTFKEIVPLLSFIFFIIVNFAVLYKLILNFKMK
jgi:hypothetical protein